MLLLAAVALTGGEVVSVQVSYIHILVLASDALAGLPYGVVQVVQVVHFQGFSHSYISANKP